MGAAWTAAALTILLDMLSDDLNQRLSQQNGKVEVRLLAGENRNQRGKLF